MTITNIKQKQTNHIFDLEDRTLIFAKRVIRLCKELPPSIVNSKLIDQLIRSSGSVGANYREANDSTGKKDFLFRLRISRKESKETVFWLELIIEANDSFRSKTEILIDECTQIRNILSTIISKVEAKNV
jgi:four helix bundle protein